MKNLLFFACGAVCASILSYFFAIRPLQDTVLMAGKGIRGRHAVEAWWLDRVAEKLDQGNIAEARRQIGKCRDVLDVSASRDESR